MPSSTALAIPGKFTTTSLTLKAKITWGEYDEACSQLAQIGGATPWWIGDAIVAGERLFSEKAAQALERFEAHGYSVAALQAMAWVSDRIEPARRLAELSWSHHREVGALEPAEQDAWLGRAVKEGWTRAKLREALREARGEGGEGEKESAKDLKARLDRAAETLRRLLSISDADAGKPVFSSDVLGALIGDEQWELVETDLLELKKALGIDGE